MSKFAKFQEYLNSRGQCQDKGTVDASGDQLDAPMPKAKEDPRRKNKPGKKPDQVKEYLDQQGKLVDKGREEAVPDYHGQNPNSPPKSITKGKGWEALSASPAEDPKPYRAVSAGAPGARGREEGFADAGDNRLVYKPGVSTGNSPYVPGGKAVAGWEGKTKTEQFIDATKNMSFSEFSEFMLKKSGSNLCVEGVVPPIKAHEAGNIYPHPAEAIRYLVALSARNQYVLENLVHSLKEAGLLGQLMQNLVEYQETYEQLVRIFEDEETGMLNCRRLARAMNESLREAVGPPIGVDDDEDEDEPKEPEEGEDDSEMGELSPDEEEIPDEDEEDDEDMGDEDMGDEDEEDLEAPPEDDEEMGPPPKAHNNMLDAMSDFDRLKKAMRAY